MHARVAVTCECDRVPFGGTGGGKEAEGEEPAASPPPHRRLTAASPPRHRRLTTAPPPPSPQARLAYATALLSHRRYIAVTIAVTLPLRRRAWPRRRRGCNGRMQRPHVTATV